MTQNNRQKYERVFVNGSFVRESVLLHFLYIYTSYMYSKIPESSIEFPSTSLASPYLYTENAVYAM